MPKSGDCGTPQTDVSGNPATRLRLSMALPTFQGAILASRLSVPDVIPDFSDIFDQLSPVAQSGTTYAAPERHNPNRWGRTCVRAAEKRRSRTARPGMRGTRLETRSVL